MKKTLFAVTIVVIMGVILMFPHGGIAGNTTACPNEPAGLTCAVVDGTIAADWTEVNCGDGNPADKYSVAVNALYDPDGNGEIMSFEFNFGTGDRTDGDPIAQSDLDIPLDSLDIDVDVDGDMDSPIAAFLKVKGLSHYTKHLKQNNAFSNICETLLNIPE